MAIVLPYPPSINSYYATFKGRRILSRKGRQYRLDVAAAVGLRKPHSGRLSISIRMYPPDRRKRDVDNILKSVLDSLGHAGVYGDDSQIDRLEIIRCEVDPPGRLCVWISPQLGEGL